MEGRLSDTVDAIRAHNSCTSMLNGENDVNESSTHKEYVVENNKPALLEVTNFGASDAAASQNGFHNGKEIKNDVLLEGRNKEQSSGHVHEDENCHSGSCKGKHANEEANGDIFEDGLTGENGKTSVSGSESPVSDDLKIQYDNVRESKVVVHSLHKEELSEAVGDNSVEEVNVGSAEEVKASHVPDSGYNKNHVLSKEDSHEAIAVESFEASMKTISVIDVQSCEDIKTTTEEGSSDSRFMTAVEADSGIGLHLDNEEKRSTKDLTANSDTKQAVLAPERELTAYLSDSHTETFLVDSDTAWSTGLPDPKNGEPVHGVHDNETFLTESESSYIQNDLFLIHEKSPFSIMNSADGTIAAENISKEVADFEVEETAKSHAKDWSTKETGMTAVISTDLEGWQRFDEQDSNVDDMLQREPQPWEQLLEDVLETSENTNDSIHIAALQGGNQSWLASPGNPFIEGLDRYSNFSEGEGFAVPSNDTSTTFPAASLRAMDNENVVRGVVSANETGTHGQVDSSNSFEAPSFMSIVDPKTDALFKASMPSYQGSNVTFGDTWEANFDPVVPSKIEKKSSLNGQQEISRSYSLSRATDSSHGQTLQEGHRWSFSAASQEGGNSKRTTITENVSQSKATGFFSPKLSPIVKKVVQKVQNAPAVANQVIHSFHHSKSNDTNKAAKKSVWTRFFCCSKSE